MEEELKILIDNVLSRYQEVYGKNCFIENPKTDLQEAMQQLKIYCFYNHHNTSLKADKLPECQSVACPTCGKMVDNQARAF